MSRRPHSPVSPGRFTARWHKTVFGSRIIGHEVSDTQHQAARALLEQRRCGFTELLAFVGDLPEDAATLIVERPALAEALAACMPGYDGDPADLVLGLAGALEPAA